MWETLEAAAAALARDGWQRDTAFWWYKVVNQPNDRKIWLELEWHHDLLWPESRDGFGDDE